MNSFFVPNLNLPEPPANENIYIRDPILRCIDKYNNHPSIKLIRTKAVNLNLFSVTEIYEKDVSNLIRDLDVKKATQDDDIPTHILKEYIDIFSPYLCSIINDSISTGNFPDTLKKAIVTPVHKKAQKLKKIIIAP